MQNSGALPRDADARLKLAHPILASLILASLRLDWLLENRIGTLHRMSCPGFTPASPTILLSQPYGPRSQLSPTRPISPWSIKLNLALTLFAAHRAKPAGLKHFFKVAAASSASAHDAGPSTIRANRPRS
jgi:hypothetical protein